MTTFRLWACLLATTLLYTFADARSMKSRDGGAPEPCHNLDGPYAPFCKPDNGSVVYVGTTYYVTWDSTFFAEKNATIYVMGNYVNTTGGQIAYQSPIQTANTGFLAWEIQKEWLKQPSMNNVTLTINPINPLDNEAKVFGGPTVMVQNEPPTFYHQPPAKAPEGQSLYIALPTVFGFILLCVVGGFFINRKHRRIGLGNVMGRRGYGVGKSRSQRLGLKKGGAIQLRERDADGGYRDAPPEERGRSLRRDSDTLGSLAGLPVEDRPNQFRDELRRQDGNRF